MKLFLFSITVLLFCFDAIERLGSPSPFLSSLILSELKHVEREHSIRLASKPST